MHIADRVGLVHHGSEWGWGGHIECTLYLCCNLWEHHMEIPSQLRSQNYGKSLFTKESTLKLQNSHQWGAPFLRLYTLCMLHGQHSHWLPAHYWWELVQSSSPLIAILLLRPVPKRCLPRPPGKLPFSWYATVSSLKVIWNKALLAAKLEFAFISCSIFFPKKNPSVFIYSNVTDDH